ncbi:MAG: NAD(P)-dependent oxidoreductase [Dermatophilaceae bacterium]
MHIALIGATGRTGRHVVDVALARGHGLTVLVRDPARLPATLPPSVQVVTGTSTDRAAVQRLVAGADAVVSALGPTAKEGDLHTRTAEVLVEVLSRSGPTRFVGVTGAGIDLPGDQKSLRDKVISKAIQTLGGAVVEDKPGEYRTFAASDLEWTLVRAPRLVVGAASGRSLQHDAHVSTRSTKLVRADLAAFLLDVVEQGLYVRQAPFVATP